MNDTETIDTRKLAQAIRFAFVCFILVLSYLGIRSSLSIGGFGMVFKDMLGGKPLPMLTVLALKSAPVFLIVSFAIPIVALGTLLQRSLTASFYILGILCLVSVAESVFLVHALGAPLFEIIKQMGGNP